MPRHVNAWTLDHDISLLHIDRYWKGAIEKDDVHLTMTARKADSINKSISVDTFSDADYASGFSRRSTGANAALMTGPSGTIAPLDFGCKVQPSTARSSGESETTHLGEVCKGLTESPITEHEHDLFLRAADRTKAAAIVAQRVAHPIHSGAGEMVDKRNRSRVDGRQNEVGRQRGTKHCGVRGKAAQSNSFARSRRSIYSPSKIHSTR